MEIDDRQVFTQVEVQEDPGGLVWPVDIDFCPDTAFKVYTPLPEALAKLNSTVTPVKTGVQNIRERLDSDLRRNDERRLLQEAH